ncbi:hypothetical protein KV100_08350 [Mumia sp. zg.B21]|uniref:hypothetical protein n=1 Tax=unclassified Mumia TaxID=2621872 RepID=UPI001C6DF8A6|nr:MULTISPECIES: hypothetical protein [unclassified Mumia]MBW9209665.1 hypothetical protein [Mumia sp. zg.B21]MDD9348478.1 hypothetical protein [Mumia sp.]
MRIELPTERVLTDKDERAAQIVATASRGRRPITRGWAGPAVASVAAAAVIGLSLAFAGDDPATSPPAVPESEVAASPTARPEPAQPDVELWLRDLPREEAAALATDCAKGMGSRRSVFEPEEVLSAQVQRGMTGLGRTAVVVAEDSATGQRIGCEIPLRYRGTTVGMDSALMRGPGSKSTRNANDTTHPAVPVDGPGGYALGYAGDTYQVDERVASMRRRFVVDGQAGPWHVARAVDGYVFLQARIAKRDLVGVRALTLETQVLDDDGNLLDAPGDQENGGGISKSPGTTRTDDRSWDLCELVRPKDVISSRTCSGPSS